MWNLKFKTNKQSKTKQKQTQKQRGQTGGCLRERNKYRLSVSYVCVSGVWDRVMGWYTTRIYLLFFIFFLFLYLTLS